MAEVLLAVGRGPSGFDKLVVLKTMRKELTADAVLRDMFLAEARISARLNHANVVQVYEVVDTTQPWIVMEYLDGQPMSAVQSRAGGDFTLPMQLRVISDVLAGLHYSHELTDYDGTPLNLVHRDVSPENVFITYNGHVKILDFGIAKRSDAPGHTQTGIIKGKLNYMPREQMLGDAVDRRADIHAAGAMLWGVAAGVKLRAKMAPGDVMRCLLEGEVPRPSQVREVDPELEAIVMKALAPAREDRHATALELQRDLDEYLKQLPPVSMRDVGALVATTFGEEREKRSLLIHASLSQPRSIPPPPEDETATSSLQLDERDIKETDGNSVVNTGVGRAWRTWPLVAAGLVALLAIGVGWAYGRSRPEPTTADVAVPEPAQIDVRVAVSPPEAQVMIDGKRYGDNPVGLRVPVDDAEHEVRGFLAGHESVVEHVRFDQDVSLHLVLKKVEVPPPPPASAAASADAKPEEPVRAAPRYRPPRAARQAPAKKDEGGGPCDPPYYYEGGIKQYKPGCL